MSLGDQIIELHRQGLSDRAIGDRLGKSKDAVRRLRHKIAGGVPASEVRIDPADRDSATVESHGAVSTLEELLRSARVDLSIWAVERHIVNAWTLADGGQAYQVKAWLKRIEGAQGVREMWDGFLADVRKHSRKVPKLRNAKRLTGRHMGEFCIFDAHIGKYGWVEEVGENTDIPLACKRIRFALDDLYDQMKPYPLEQIILPWGNDLQHYDTQSGLTTAGTPQDRDSRYAKMFRAACEISVYAIDQAAAIASTKVIIVPGNHDSMSTWNLGEYLIAWYRNDQRVEIDNQPTPRKYHSYGNTLLGFCHGNDEPIEKLPAIMAVEQPLLWGQSRYREFHNAHLHTSKATDAKPVRGNNGVRIRTLQSLSGLDNWHKRKGYVGEPGCAEAFVWSYDRGLRANLFSNRQSEAA